MNSKYAAAVCTIEILITLLLLSKIAIVICLHPSTSKKTTVLLPTVNNNNAVLKICDDTTNSFNVEKDNKRTKNMLLLGFHYFPNYKDFDAGNSDGVTSVQYRDGFRRDYIQECNLDYNIITMNEVGPTTDYHYSGFFSTRATIIMIVSFHHHH